MKSATGNVVYITEGHAVSLNVLSIKWYLLIIPGEKWPRVAHCLDRLKSGNTGMLAIIIMHCHGSEGYLICELLQHFG